VIRPMPGLKATIVAGALAIVTLAGPAQARDQIRIVGSSTVFPFSTAVAETFGRSTKFKTPVVESTGSGGGLKLFCSGAGDAHPAALGIFGFSYLDQNADRIQAQLVVEGANGPTTPRGQEILDSRGNPTVPVGDDAPRRVEGNAGDGIAVIADGA